MSTVLSDNNTVAFRKKGFADGITFSERPIQPGEVFLLEIEGNEAGWSGYMKLGLTQMDPSQRFPLPAFSKPHLVDSSPVRSWIFPVHSNMDSSDRGHQHQRAPRRAARRRLSGAVSSSSSSQETSSSSDTESASSPSEYNYSEYSPEEVEETFEELTLNARQKEWGCGYVLPTDVGSQVGVVYRVNRQTGLADMHFILNGMDRGVKAESIPYKDAPLFAVVDVYGTTKKLRIVSESGSLQSACREVILSRLSGNDVSQLPLPNKLKKFLRQKMRTTQQQQQPTLTS